MAVIALVTGIYRLRRRKAAGLLEDVLGVEISLGASSAVEARGCDALKPAALEAWERVASADVKHTDAASSYQAGATMALWTIATRAATVFKIVANATLDTLRPPCSSCDANRTLSISRSTPRLNGYTASTSVLRAALRRRFATDRRSSARCVSGA